MTSGELAVNGGAYVLHAAPDLDHKAEATCALRLPATVCVGVEEAFGEP